MRITLKAAFLFIVLAVFCGTLNHLARFWWAYLGVLGVGLMSIPFILR